MVEITDFRKRRPLGWDSMAGRASVWRVRFQGADVGMVRECAGGWSWRNLLSEDQGAGPWSGATQDDCLAELARSLNEWWAMTPEEQAIWKQERTERGREVRRRLDAMAAAGRERRLRETGEV